MGFNTSTPVKRYAGLLRYSDLFDDQKIVYDQVFNFLFDSSIRFGKLDGQAGTGKTFLLSVIVEAILIKNTLASIVMCAPTHKAVKVMEAQCDYFHERLSFMTLHSLLGVEEYIDNFGQQVFKPTFEGSKVKQFSIIICDEYSMISNELFDALEEHKSVKVLFVGDINQIPPIGLPLTKVADPEVIDFFNIAEFNLHTIRRQSANNPIISLANDIIHDQYSFKTVLVDDTTGVQVLTADYDNSLEIEDILRFYFCSPKFNEDPDYMKVVAWTNPTVNYMNNIIRGLIYGEEDLTKLKLGEKLIADKPIKDDEGKILFSTNQEFEVSSFYVDTYEIPGGADEDPIELTYYAVDVDYFTKSGRLVSVPIRILHEDSEDLYNQILLYLKDQAINAKKSGKDAKSCWRSYYAFQAIFAQVKYNYAITAHKSQGSTYENCFVLAKDICKNPDNDTLKKILYTAVTRAKNKLYIY